MTKLYGLDAIYWAVEHHREVYLMNAYSFENTKITTKKALQLIEENALESENLIWVDADDYGVWMQKRRKELNLSQRDLAQAAGLTQAAIIRLEKGSTEPRPSTRRKIEKILGERK